MIQMMDQRAIQMVRYLPSGHGNNQSDSDIVKTQDTRSSSGGHTTEVRTIYFSEDPDACKKALEEANDSSAEWVDGSSNFSMGTGQEILLDDWLNSRGKWPSLLPIFFPGPKVPGIALLGSDIARHTRAIINGIR